MFPPITSFSTSSLLYKQLKTLISPASLEEVVTCKFHDKQANKTKQCLKQTLLYNNKLDQLGL